MSRYLLPNGDAITLGTRVRYARKLVRRTAGSWRQKAWVQVDVAGAPAEGIVVGVRTLADGRTEGGGYEEDTYFVAEAHVRAVMVVSHLSRRPAFVAFDELTLVDDTPAVLS